MEPEVKCRWWKMDSGFCQKEAQKFFLDIRYSVPIGSETFLPRAFCRKHARDFRDPGDVEISREEYLVYEVMNR